MAPQRRPDRTYASAASTLLAPQLLTRTRDQLAVLGGMGSCALTGAIVLYRFPEQVLVDAAENLFGQLEAAYFFPGQI